jgi:Reverse transcriptase (RNA-dependent DNA polymerase)
MGTGIVSVRQASWRVPAGASPAQVRRSGRLVVSVAWWKVTTTAKRTQRLCGVIIVRYADDVVLGFEHETDARRFLGTMKARLEKFSLALHPDKTRDDWGRKVPQ